MKPLIVAALCLSTLPAWAQSICRSYEYAELRDMRSDRLASLYCDYDRSMRTMLDVALQSARSGNIRASQHDMAASNRCAQELDRIERILQGKPACPAH